MTRHRRDPALLRTVIAFAAFAVLVVFAAIPTEIGTQLALAAATCVMLVGMSWLRPTSSLLRIFVILLTVFTSTRYMYWRTTETLPWGDPLGLFFGFCLLAAEFYGYTILLLSTFIMTDAPRRVPPHPPLSVAKCPSVDVLIPSYNEDPELLKATLIAAVNIEYPKEKLAVYLLDDGGTVQKRTQADPLKAAEARARNEELIALCESLGAHYLTREKNEHAKAGNVNSALAQTDGELVLILDADHIPTRDILTRTAGYFIADPKLFLVQTPHFFINADPLERNLDTFEKMPGENEMFYSVMQPGLDSFNAAFFCGSAAVIRRSCLDEIGGLAGDTITEDAETALELHARGYRSAYVTHPLIAGLAPETYTGFIIQRMRWAQGMAQIFLMKNPLFKPGLKFAQRIGYLNSCFFWFFPLARIVFILGPILFLLFGVHILDAKAVDFAAYGLPHVLGAILLSVTLFGRVRWLFASELYEIIQSVHCAGAIIQVFRNPRAPSFAVTPKGENVDQDFISPLSGSFYWLVFGVVLAQITGLTRLAVDPSEFGKISVLLVWNTFHLLLLLCAVGVMFERAQRREAPRPGSKRRLVLRREADLYPITTRDISATGFGLDAPLAASGVYQLGNRFTVDGFDPIAKESVRIPTLCVSRRDAPDCIKLGFVFEPERPEQERATVNLVFGDSRDWKEFRDNRASSGGMTGKVFFLLANGVERAILHFRALATGGAL